MEKWNLIIVDKYDYPRPADREIQVESETILGAVMKGNKIIKREYPNCKIRSAWRLDPKNLKERANER